MVVALLHAFAAFLFYPTDILDTFSYSLSPDLPRNTVASEAYWFFFFAPLGLAVGLLIDRAEFDGRQTGLALPILLLVMTLMMLLPRPLNGAWLLLPPFIALLLRERRLSSDQELPNKP